MKNFWIVGFWTMISRFLGLLREMFLSHILGAGGIADAFIVAIKLPNFFRRFSAEGALNSSFVPYYTRLHTTQGPRKANALLSKIFIIMAITLTLFVILGELNIERLVKLAAPGFKGEHFETTLYFTKLTFPYILFISLSALLTGAANSLGRFAPGAISQSILNILLIVVLLYSFCEKPNAVQIGYNLCFGFVIAGVLQQAWMHLACKKSGIHMVWVNKPLDKDSKVILKRMIPGIIGASVAQLSIFVDTIMASFLKIGSISFLYYADRLYQLPLSIFGTTISTVILPPLSRLWSRGEKEKALSLQKKYLYFSLFLTCPAAVGLCFLSTSLIDLIYGHGKFTSTDIAYTADALFFFAMGLPAHVTSKIFNATFFSLGDTKTPLFISLLSVGLNITLNFLLMPRFEHAGLAMATSVSAWFNLFLSLYILNKKKYFSCDLGIFVITLKVIIPSCVVAFILLGLDVLNKNFWLLSCLPFVFLSVFLSLLVVGAWFYFDFEKSPTFKND